jgi:hypothetical protein
MQPEHFDLSTPVFLPVTHDACTALLQADGEKTLVSLTEPELAAILVIQNLAQASEKDLTASAAEKTLAKLMDWAVDARGTGSTAGLLSEAQRLFDPRKLYFGLNAIKGLNLRFLMADEVAEQGFLLADGKWDVDYKIRHKQQNNPFIQQMVTPRHRERWLSDAQDKLLRTFRANLDEDLHVQGYAGIGKSHLLGALVECLRSDRTLILARTPAKLETLRKHLKQAQDKDVAQTFRHFARTQLYGPRPPVARTPARMPSKQALAQELNIFGFRRHDGQGTLDVCLRVLALYCGSRDHSLSARHLPFFQQPLSPADTQVLLEYSSRLWIYLETNPVWASQTGFETLLMIKRASLSGCRVPARYTHVIIDESQDVPASLLQIIERGRQVLITLGDEYQQASGEAMKRKREVRQSDISYSVRSGRNVERLVNPLISRHSHKSKVPFEGARNADVDIEHYPQGFVPPEGCVILTASPWDTMMWAIHLHDANCAFSFPDKDMQAGLKHFMTTAIELFNPQFYDAEFSEKGRHPYFSDLVDWQQVREANQFDEAFVWGEAELGKGFRMADLTRLNGRVGEPGKACMLMMAEQAGGMEFNRVLLTGALLSNEKFKDAYEFDQRICAVYIAISRARQQLYLPYDVVEWIEYHDSREPKFRESHGY